MLIFYTYVFARGTILTDGETEEGNDFIGRRRRENESETWFHVWQTFHSIYYQSCTNITD